MPRATTKTSVANATNNCGVYLFSYKGEPVYVGASTNLGSRISGHRKILIGRLEHRHGWKDWDKAYKLNQKGILKIKDGDVKARILEFVNITPFKGNKIEDHPELCEREKFWIKKLKPRLNTLHNRNNEPADIASLPVGPP